FSPAFTDQHTTQINPLSLHDALPISNDFQINPRNPESGASMNRQIRVTIVTDRTAEEKKMPRKIAAPLLARFSAIASTSDSTVRDRKSTRLNSSHSQISYAVFCLKKK